MREESTEDSDSVRWVTAYAEHVRKRFNSRAVVSVRVSGQEPMTLSQVYALEGGGLVLVIPGDDGDPEDRHRGHHDHAHDEHEHERVSAELWIASAEHVAFEARPAEDGVLCTGFGYLGASRTPDVLVPRGTEPPPKRGHEHGDF